MCYIIDGNIFVIIFDIEQTRRMDSFIRPYIAYKIKNGHRYMVINDNNDMEYIQ